MTVVRARGREGLKASFEFAPGINTSADDVVKKRLEIELQHDPNTQLASNLTACKELPVRGVDRFVLRVGKSPDVKFQEEIDRAMTKVAAREVKYKKRRQREEK